ncbi:hypothetical protein [Brevibacillus laterosporus]|uniref:hypothetical protein n=1 Tax=Brevibacillus laterosporus TaxID=1465 RepID=UPI0003B1E86A|nr:hypothetical protein [Brevibacillus laterosporus]ERM20359.1 hypothetical protein P615_00190 [Brevibacillus laterosporus PE36]
MTVIIQNPKPLSQIEKDKEDAKMPIATLGQELAETKLELAQKDTLMQMFGRELASLKLEFIQSKGSGE